MNLEDMKKMMNMIENMNGKSPVEIISENNPRFSHLKNFNNPADILSGMGNFSGMDIGSVMKMMSNIQNQSGQRQPRPEKSYFGLSPIAKFAPPEIIYELNRYLSEL